MALTSTVLDSIPALGSDGAVVVNAILFPDNNMPANGWDVTPALFGLTRFKPAASGVDLQRPVVSAIFPPTAEASIGVAAANKLILSYTSGGGAVAPTVPAAPLLTVGAVAVTSNAANGANDLTPGIGKVFPTAADGTAFSVQATAIGYR